MSSNTAQPYPSAAQDIPERQCFRATRSTSAGAIGPPSPLLHLTRIGTALAPLIVLEAVKEPARQTRWIRICALAGAAISETVWAMRESQRRRQYEARDAERARERC